MIQHKRFESFLALFLLTIAAALPVCQIAHAEEPAAEKRPRIGLVLSGGGARGLAHIGVIAVLEEMKIPVDVIAGTSMGAIVGGFYASGMSPADMEKVVRSMDWNEAFKDRPPPSDLPFRRKQDAADYLINFDLGFRDGKFAVPKGLLQGQNLNLMLKSYLLSTEGIDDFDKLPIPFRAVAADIETGEAVVLARGDLVTAIRASMSLPGIFAPVDMEDRLLVDGGVANNLPVDIARQMGADIVIAVDISTPLGRRKALASSVEITAQLTSILIQRNTADQIRMLRERDVLIQPHLGNITTGEFSRAREAVLAGRAQAESMKDILSGLSVSEPQYLAFLHKQRKHDNPLLEISEIDIINQTTLPTGVIRSQMSLQPGAPLDMAALKKNIDAIYGIDMFERVDFFLRRKDQTSAIVIRPLEKSWGPNYFRFGLGLEDNFKGASHYALTAQFTKTAINRLAGEWRTEIRIGESPRFFTEFYQPIDYSLQTFVAAGAQYAVKNINAYDEAGGITSQYRAASFMGSLAVGRELGKWGEIRAGVSREQGTVQVLVGDHSVGEDPYGRASVFASAAYSTVDNYVFPLKGTNASVVWNYNLRALGSDIEVQSLGLEWTAALTWSKFTFLPAISVRTTLDSDDLEVQDTFPLGGFLKLSGYSTDELYGRHTGLARLVIYRELASAGIGALKMPLYLGLSSELGNVWSKRADIHYDSLILAGSIFLGTKTYLGPIYLAYGQAQRGHSSFYLYLGQRF